MAALICGSLAFDTIMTFEGRFAEQILPQQLHILNVSFLVPSLRRDFGGCAGNIAYSLRLLGGDPRPMAMLGSDGADYMARLAQLGIDTGLVGQVDDTYTAQAMIMTDRDNNQITAFHPGAMMQAHRNRVAAHADLRVGRWSRSASPSSSIRGRGCPCSRARSFGASSSRHHGLP
jgi:adenosine kinase